MRDAADRAAAAAASLLASTAAEAHGKSPEEHAAAYSALLAAARTRSGSVADKVAALRALGCWLELGHLYGGAARYYREAHELALRFYEREDWRCVLAENDLVRILLISGDVANAAKVLAASVLYFRACDLVVVDCASSANTQWAEARLVELISVQALQTMGTSRVVELQAWLSRVIQCPLSTLERRRYDIAEILELAVSELNNE